MFRVALFRVALFAMCVVCDVVVCDVVVCDEVMNGYEKGLSQEPATTVLIPPNYERDRSPGAMAAATVDRRLPSPTQ
jgi:hypothetical protein